jgi:phage FluMu gp28-like protein
MSHTTAAVGVLWGAFHGELTTFISIGDREAGEVLEKAKLHREVLTELGSRMALTRKRDNTTEIDFASGGRIIALPATAGRSFSGNIFLDEHAYQQHEAKVWDAAMAVTMHGFSARVASTPNGVGNGFHNLWKSADDLGWVRHQIPLERALADGMHVDITDCWKMAKGDPRLFSQFFECKFLDNELQYIPSVLIDECSTDALQTSDGAYFAGLDIGKTVDRTVLTVVRKTGGLVVVQHIESCKRTDSEVLEAMVARAFKRYDLRRLCIDSTGMGSFPATALRKKHGMSKVEPVNFTLQVKEDLATALYTAFAEHNIRIPRTVLPGCHRDEPAQLREDIAALKRIITSAGNVRYDAPHTDQGHADRAWSLAMALHAAMTAPSYARLQ